MFDIGWTEMLVLGIVTLLAVGPRELPGLLRTIGRYVGQMRDMAGDFRRQMDDVAEEIDAREQFKKLTKETLGDDFSAPDLFDLEEPVTKPVGKSDANPKAQDIAKART